MLLPLMIKSVVPLALLLSFFACALDGATITSEDETSGITAGLLRANQKNSIGLRELPSTCMDVQITILLEGTINHWTMDDRISWQIVDDCPEKEGSPPGYRYDAVGGNVEWQDCIPPGMYIFTMWNNSGGNDQGKVEIVVNGEVIRSRYRSYSMWQDVMFGTSSCPTEHAEVARTI